MRKRILCFLLLLPMVLVSASAVTGDQDETHDAPSNGGDYDWASGWWTGLALGIQTMKDAKYTVAEKTVENTGTQYAEGIEFIEGAAVNNKGLANVAQHFMYSYPNPDTESGETVGTVYILPKTTVEPQYLTSMSEGKIKLVNIGTHYYANVCGENYKSKRPIYQVKDMTVAEELYTAATSETGIKDINYFKGYIAKMDHDTARDLIGYIFAPSKYRYISGNNVQQVDVATVIERWKEVYENDVGTHSDVTEDTIQKICNYASILLSLARILPEENWEMYEQNIGQFVVGALNGKSYSPVVVTAEMCINYRYEKGYNYNSWRTVVEHLALCTKVVESEFRNAESDPLYVGGLGNYTNMAQVLIKTAIAKHSSSGYAQGNIYGCSATLGLDLNGNLNGKGDYCRAMTSVDKATIKSIRTDWGLSVPHDESTAALWGCGIFGGTEALTVAPQHKAERSAKHL